MRFLFIFVLGFFHLMALEAYATPMSLTGRDILENGSFTFPNGLPQLVGDSIEYDPGDGEVLFATSVQNFVSTPLEFSVSFSLTRLTFEYDPSFFITDGTRIFGGAFGDNANGAFTLLPGVLDPGGATTTQSESDVDLIPVGFGFPAIGGDYEGRIDFDVLPDGVRLVFSANGLSHEFLDSRPFDIGADVQFLFAGILNAGRDGERYQLNNLTFSSPSTVSEPSTLFGFLLALLTGGAAYRRCMKS